MFVKELILYIKYFRNSLSELTSESTKKEVITLKKFQKNLNAGIEYYLDLFDSIKEDTIKQRDEILNDFINLRDDLNTINVEAVPAPTLID